MKHFKCCAILAAIQRGARISIDVSERVPIYLVYFTAWEDEYGIQFRRDLYGQDKLLLEMLHKPRRSSDSSLTE